jgi:Cys-tRNA(Pro) deacylase
MPNEISASAARVQDALRALGINATVVELPATTRTASEAALAIGCRVEQIVKSIVFRAKTSGIAVLVVASGPNRINERTVAAMLGEAIEKATPDFVREHTGYVIGGVPPLGHREAIETFVDQDLLQYAEIWAAAGTPHAVFKLTPEDLVRMAGGRVTSIH